jgi:hypothetical protein
MSDVIDWRLRNQQRYLRGIALAWRRYGPTISGSDHDHCEFCFAKFMLGGEIGTLGEGYASAGGDYWICKSCFDDFSAQFNWQVS